MKCYIVTYQRQAGIDRVAALGRREVGARRKRGFQAALLPLIGRDRAIARLSAAA